MNHHTKNKLYPFLFHRNLHSVIWRGNQLTSWKKLPQLQDIGRSKEVSAVVKSLIIGQI